MVYCLRGRPNGGLSPKRGTRARGGTQVTGKCMPFLVPTCPPTPFSFFLSFQLCSQAGYELKIPLPQAP